jgi:nascent polypeptide-associated complex subunit alpha
MKINPKQLERMAKRMGIQTQTIDAEEVIIKTPDKDIVISNPQVSKINMMGQETFQIMGEISEAPKEKFSAEDIKMIMDQTGASETKAKNTLEQTHDLAEAILKLKKELR